MHPIHPAILLLTTATLTLTPLQAQTVRLPSEVAATLRAQTEESRLKSVPPPSPGTRDLRWHELSPPSWNPRAILERLRVDQLEDNDPRAPALMREIRKEWDRAPALRSLDKTKVRITGFPVMLDDGEADTSVVLLAPYYGACVHAPTPAANQMVYVRLDKPISREMFQFPIWVEGTLQVRNTGTRHGRVAYAMEEARWTPYPFRQFRMPQYQLPSAH